MYIHIVLTYKLCRGGGSCSSKHRMLPTDLRSSLSGSSTLRKQPPGRGWVGPYPVSKSCEETTSWPLFCKNDSKNTALFFRAISNSQAKNYMAILCSYDFNQTRNFRTNHIAVSLPSRKNKYATSQYAHCLLYGNYKIITTVTKESQSIAFWASFTKSLFSSAP